MIKKSIILSLCALIGISAQSCSTDDELENQTVKVEQLQSTTNNSDTGGVLDDPVDPDEGED